MRVASPFCVRQKAYYCRVTPPEASQFFWLYWGLKGGGLCSPIWSGAPQRSTERGTSVNRPHSRGIKEALHWFVLEAVLLICLPMNECVGPVFSSCGQWHSRPVLTGRMLFPENGVHYEEFGSFHLLFYSTNLSHTNRDGKLRKANRWPLVT